MRTKFIKNLKQVTKPLAKTIIKPLEREQELQEIARMAVISMKSSINKMAERGGLVIVKAIETLPLYEVKWVKEYDRFDEDIVGVCPVYADTDDMQWKKTMQENILDSLTRWVDKQE